MFSLDNEPLISIEDLPQSMTGRLKRLKSSGGGSDRLTPLSQSAQDLAESALALLDWHPMPIDEEYTRTVEVNALRLRFKVAHHPHQGLRIWTQSDDYLLVLALSADPNHKVQWVDPDQVDLVNSIVRATAIGETVGAWMGVTNLAEWETPSRQYYLRHQSDANRNTYSIQVDRISAVDASETHCILALNTAEITLNQVNQQDLREFQKFGRHFRHRLALQQYAQIMPLDQTVRMRPPLTLER